MTVRVGLTGGIGAGKSTVSELLAELGAIVIDADLLAREVVKPGTDGLAEIVDRFGADVIGADGALDRAALGRIVFADPDARAELNAIIHPRVRARAAELEAAAPDDAVVVHDIPLLVETGQQDSFDAVVVVDASPETQVDRLTRLRGMAADEARSRIAAQASPEQRKAAADYVLVNDGPRADLRPQVEAVWRLLVAPAA